jgi:hypothetical protein
LARLEHLNIFGMVRDRSRVAEWYGAAKRGQVSRRASKDGKTRATSSS